MVYIISTEINAYSCQYFDNLYFAKIKFAGNFCYNFYFLHIVLTNYAHYVKKRNNTKVCQFCV